MSVFTQTFQHSVKQQVNAFLIVASIVFICALFGILARPLFFLSICWPTNAALLGLFLRFKSLNNLGGWTGAFTAFMLADLLTGNTFLITLLLTIANLLNPLVSLSLITLFRLNYKEYNKGLTFLYLFILCSIGGCLASPAFAALTLPYIDNTFMTLERVWIDFGMWWSGEILNMIAFLPILLAIPDKQTFHDVIQNIKLKGLPFQIFLPLIAVIISVSLTHFFIGPGALMFPIAALVWASLTYNLFFIALINCVVCMLLNNTLSEFYIHQSSNAFLATSISIRMGLFMLALGPLTLAIISLNRQKLYQQILYLANHDSLTTVMNRRFFYEQSEDVVGSTTKIQTEKTITVLLLDLDHFKKINDQHGHYNGDIVLKTFTQRIKNILREDDLFGRLGGEEFAILLKNVNLNQSIIIAERIREIIQSTPTALDNGEQIYISVSIGLSFEKLPYALPFQQLINRADHALYQAKEKGRNQICLESNLRTIT